MPDFPKLPAVADEPISLVLLACGAADHLESVVDGWFRALSRRLGSPRPALPRDEIVLVEDGTATGVAEMADRLTVQYPLIAWQRFEERRGPGAMLRVGLTAATRPLVATAPCTPAYPPEFLKKLLEAIDPVHLVSGYRAGRPVPAALRGVGKVVRGAVNAALGLDLAPLPGWLGWRGHLAHWTARAVFGVRARDVGCPFRLFRREVLWRMPVQSDGSFAHLELLAKATFQGLDCLMGEEVPLPVTPAQDGLPLSPVGRSLREGYRLFAHPDFGPPVAAAAAPPPEVPAAEAPPSAI
jgi:hypothetical protein